jgi:DNA-binding transcriptional LysR family regulator
MRLRHIEIFHAVMQTGTISGAAQLLNISQPAATKVLQHCELQLGLKLFERIRGKLHPTPEAHRLFGEVDKLQRDLQAVRRLAANLKTNPAEAVRLASTPTLSITLIPEALARWRQRFEKVHCTLATFHTAGLVNSLLVGDTDLAFSLYDPCHPGIHSEAIIRGNMTVIAPAETWPEELHGQPLKLCGLPKNLIGIDLDDHLVSRLLDACEDEGTVFESSTMVQTYLQAKTLVELGAGAAVVDPFTAAIADRSKTACRPVFPAVGVDLYLLSRKATPLSRSAHAFVDAVRQTANDHIARASAQAQSMRG